MSVGQAKKCKKSDDCGDKSFCHHWEGADSETAYCMHCEAVVIVDYKCSSWKMLSAEGKKECEAKCKGVKGGVRDDDGEKIKDGESGGSSGGGSGGKKKGGSESSSGGSVEKKGSMKAKKAPCSDKTPEVPVNPEIR